LRNTRGLYCIKRALSIKTIKRLIQANSSRDFRTVQEGNICTSQNQKKNFFPGSAIDQTHEQENYIVKGDGGVVGITDDQSAPRRWMVARPEVSHLINQYKTVYQAKTATNEQINASPLPFSIRVHKLLNVVKEFSNRFQEESRDPEGFVTLVDTVPSCDASTLDGSAMVYILAPRTSRTLMNTLRLT
jgi:hypothetical protein